MLQRYVSIGYIRKCFQKNYLMDTSRRVGERIKAIRDIFHLSQTEFSEKIGLARTYVSAIEAGKKQPSSHLLQAMADMGVSIDYILQGFGSPLVKRSDLDNVHLNVHSDVHLHQKLHFVRGPESGLERPVGGVPVVQHSRAAAGLPVGTAAGELLEDMGWLQLPGLPLTHGQWVAVYADGESMQPTVQDGDLLVCRRLEDALYLRQNTVCVVCTADNAIVKRVRLKGTTLLMSSDNPSYEPYTLPGHEVTQLWEVIRRVTGHLDPLPPFSAELESRIAALEKRRK